MNPEELIKCVANILIEFCGKNEYAEVLKKRQIQVPEDGSPYMISYIVDTGGRYKCKTGRFLSKNFSAILLDDQIQKASAAINAEVWGKVDNIVEILEGEAVRKFYHQSYSGISSCMSYDSAQEYLDIYVDNPEIIKLATVKFTAHNKNNAARGLLWHIKKKRYLDVVYHSSTLANCILNQWADENDVINDEMWNKNLEVEIKLRNGDNGPFPYMDSMRNLTAISYDKGRLSTTSGNMTLDCTEGYTEGNDRINCEQCDTSIYEDDACGHNGSYYCADCYNEYVYYCTCCGQWRHKEIVDYEVIQRDNICKNCVSRYYTECDDCGEYIHNDDINEYSVGNYCNKCSENYSECSNCNEVCPLDELEDDLCEECQELKSRKKATSNE